MIYLNATMSEIIAQLERSVILDTETTSLNGEVIDLGIIDGRDGSTLINTLIKPTRAIEPEAEAIHHISMAMVANAPTFAEAWPEIAHRINGRYIITYNAKFDCGRVLESAQRSKTTLPYAMSWVCAMLAYATYWGEPNRYGNASKGPAWQRLGAACQQQGAQFEGEAHRAISDCKATYNLIRCVQQHIATGTDVKYGGTRHTVAAPHIDMEQGRIKNEPLR